MGKGPDMDRVLHRLQVALHKIEVWCTTWKLRILPEKCEVINLSNLRPTSAINLCMEGRAIPEVSNIKILGIFFSKSLSFTYHFSNLQKKCLKKLNAVRAIASTFGGARSKFLINIINSTIRGSLEYGCQVFLATNKTDLRKLEVIYNQGLRFACGLPKWTPIPVIFAEANEPPLKTRLQFLAEKFVVKQAALKFGQVDPHCIHNQPYNPTSALICTKLWMMQPSLPDYEDKCLWGGF
ncbi:hypothetical protein JTE90_020746 [Oedothorax gibbosus]|uniref:Reverse transcriptase n=1 Tax=Oedothorax gibbosus TaxID=931172 RepID=A0AAV6TIG7_9ARAC|nr:hypothetical protein JTE90_020746 [Oedothorax gibbosus]